MGLPLGLRNTHMRAPTITMPARPTKIQMVTAPICSCSLEWTRVGVSGSSAMTTVTVGVGRGAVAEGGAVGDGDAVGDGTTVADGARVGDGVAVLVGSAVGDGEGVGEAATVSDGDTGSVADGVGDGVLGTVGDWVIVPVIPGVAVGRVAVA